VVVLEYSIEMMHVEGNVNLGYLCLQGWLWRVECSQLLQVLTCGWYNLFEVKGCGCLGDAAARYELLNPSCMDAVRRMVAGAWLCLLAGKVVVRVRGNEVMETSLCAGCITGG
jgi:hypothetical protein